VIETFRPSLEDRDYQLFSLTSQHVPGVSCKRMGRDDGAKREMLLTGGTHEWAEQRGGEASREKWLIGVGHPFSGCFFSIWLLGNCSLPNPMGEESQLAGQCSHFLQHLSLAQWSPFMRRCAQCCVTPILSPPYRWHLPSAEILPSLYIKSAVSLPGACCSGLKSCCFQIQET
jgi:hypothetical protein